VEAPKESLRLWLSRLSQASFSALGFTTLMTFNGGDMDMANGVPDLVHGETGTDHQPTT